MELVQQGLIKQQVWEQISNFKWKKSKDIFHGPILICQLSVKYQDIGRDGLICKSLSKELVLLMS